MSRFHFHVAGLRGVVLLLAVGMAAVRAATALRPSAIFTVAVILFSTAVFGVMATRGSVRFTWAGRAVFAWIYLALAFSPWRENPVLPPPLLTEALLDYVRG